MTYTVFVNILPHDPLLDPQGKATLGGLHHLGFAHVADVRVGKRIRLKIEADSPDGAREQAQQAAQKLLANPIMEGFELEVLPA